MIVIEVKNAAALAAREKGFVGQIAGAVLPSFIQAQVESAIRDRLVTSLGAEGVQVDVRVVDEAPPAGAAPSEIVPLVIAAGVGLALGALVASS